ncbi:MAG: hypothetical protein LUD77_07975 [Clostridiales bacterium]|nr:hypothetical protein [Clostridiales bacterium]
MAKSLKSQMTEDRYDYSKTKYNENFKTQPKKSNYEDQMRAAAGKEVKNNGLTSALTYVKKYYLEDLSDYNTVKPGNSVKQIVIENNVKLFKLNGIVFNKKENILDKLNNIYGTLHSLGISLVLFIINDGRKIDYYFGAKSTNDIKENVTWAFNKAFTGNFPGNQLEEISASKYKEILNSVLPENGSNAVSSLSCIPSLKDDDADNSEYVQGIEKLVDTMYGEKYALMVISNPVGESHLEEVKQGYEELYSELFSLADFDLTLGSSDAQSVSESELDGYTKTIGKSISKTQSFTKGTSTARSKSRTNTIGSGFGFMGNYGLNNSTGILSDSGLVKQALSRIGGILIGASRGASRVLGGNMFGNASKSQTEGKTTTGSYNIQTGTQEGKNVSEAFSSQKGTQVGTTATTSSSSSVKFEDKAIKNLLEVIEEHIKRLKDCENYGMWSTAAYFISPSRETASVSASTYKSIMNGDNTSLETSCVNSWYNDANVKCINEYLRKVTHPSFYSKDFLIDLEASTNVTAATMISTRELSIQCGIPYKSIPGVSVREMAEFGRSVSDRSAEGKKIKLGNIYHMGKDDKNTTVDLNIERLKEHTFVTGSTGSGKSNTFQI